jgi:2-phospho-L-lactate/phosphoenolpyruvate guanylyltransferase
VSACAIVPQKSLAVAKSRLGTALPTGARATVSLALLNAVCAVLRATPGIETVVVMTPDPEVRAFAATRGVPAVPDPAPGLNEALAGVFRSLSTRSRAILVVSADLPLLQPADVAAMLAEGDGRTLVLAPSKDRLGTNALLLPPAVPVRPAFGHGSLAAHRRRGRALGVRVAEVRRPGLAYDLDTPADLAALGGWVPLRRSVL